MVLERLRNLFTKRTQIIATKPNNGQPNHIAIEEHRPNQTEHNHNISEHSTSNTRPEMSRRGFLKLLAGAAATGMLAKSGLAHANVERRPENIRETERSRPTENAKVERDREDIARVNRPQERRLYVRERGLGRRGNLEFGETNQFQYLQYTLNRGDTIASLVDRFCNFATPQQRANLISEILRRNGIENASGIRPNQMIRIPLIMARPTIREIFENRSKSFSVDRGTSIYQMVARYTDFTGSRLSEVAREIAYINGLTNPDAIRAGTTLYFPNSYLSTEELRPEETRREQERLTEAREIIRRNQPTRTPLNRLHVILDIGHGGNDPGVVHTQSGMREANITHNFVQTHLIPLLRERGINVHTINRSGPNQRFTETNQLETQLRRRGVAHNNILFISVHADSLHESVRGATIYVPGEEHYRENNSQTRRAREMYSRSLANNVINQFRQQGVHANPRPIRDVIHGRGRPFVPRVIRSNPHYGMLIELGNINNVQDRANMNSRNELRKIANSIVNGIANEF